VKEKEGGFVSLDKRIIGRMLLVIVRDFEVREIFLKQKDLMSKTSHFHIWFFFFLYNYTVHDTRERYLWIETHLIKN